MMKNPRFRNFPDFSAAQCTLCSWKRGLDPPPTSARMLHRKSIATGPAAMGANDYH